METLIEMIPLVIFGIAGGVSYHLAHRAMGKVLYGLWLCWLFLSAAFLYGYLTAPGWDALLFMLMLAGISAPMAVGAMIGGLIGAVRRDNAKPD